MLVISTNHKCLKPSTRDCQCFFQGSIDDRGKFQHLPYGMFNILRIARKKTCLAGHEIKKKSPVIKGSLGEETSVLRTFGMSGKELVKERVSEGKS